MTFGLALGLIPQELMNSLTKINFLRAAILLEFCGQLAGTVDTTLHGVGVAKRLQLHSGIAVLVLRSQVLLHTVWWRSPS